MADSSATNGVNDRESPRLASSLLRIPYLLPGMMPQAPKRNVPVALAYLLLASLAIGLLDWLL